VPAGPGSEAVQKVLADTAACLELAHRQGRVDLVERLQVARRRLLERDLSVVVVGEFKKGKSSLINAVVKTTVCPVDDDIVTAVPTMVRYGDAATAIAHFEQEQDADEDAVADVRSEPIPFDRVRDYVSEQYERVANERIRSVEIRLNRRVLRSGLILVDTPGVGGLDSAHGNITLGALPMAHAALFVTDCSQELTQSELTFLQQAQSRCPNIACVVTKIDLYPEWRDVVAANQRHLSAAGVSIPILAVSSFLRLRAATTDDGPLNEESGYPDLFTFLRVNVVEGGAALAAAAAAREVVFVTGQLRQAVSAEAAVIAEPARAEQIVERAQRANAAATALRAPAASWQQALADGVQDLVADVEHDLRERLRAVGQSAEQVIERGDPVEAWDDFEAWIQRQVTTEAVANHDYLVERTNDLVDRVGQQFQLEAVGTGIATVSAPLDAIDRVRLRADFEPQQASKGTLVLATARSSYGAMLMFGMVGSLLSFALAPGISLLLGAGIGRKAFRDERARQLAARRQHAKTVVRQYIDQVSFVMGKECRDALRRTQRDLRDEFTARARVAERSSSDALAFAQRARQLSESGRLQRSAVIQQDLDALDRLGDRAAVAAGVG
jgi:hypothetical protein